MDFLERIVEVKHDLNRFIEKLMQFGFEYYRRYYGPYKASVISNEDPDGCGRVQVHCPRASLSKDNKIWVLPMMQGAGKNHGEFWPPEKGDIVFVFFDNGDPGVPLCYMGGWYAKSEVQADLNPGSKAPKKRGWVTPAGNEIILDDTSGSEEVLIKQKGGRQVKVGKNKVSVGSSNGQFEPMMRGSTVKQYLISHTHPHSYGPTGPPKEPFPTNGLSNDTETS